MTLQSVVTRVIQDMPTHTDPILHRLIRWGEAEPPVRAMILTSSRAVPDAPVDAFSDYDVILVLEDIRPFYDDAGWMTAFGAVLANYRDPLSREDDHLTSAYVTQWEDGLKIDFTLWPVGLLREIAAAPTLPPELDAGYRVLLDKDGLAAGLQPPTRRGYIPTPPTMVEFQAELESFFLDALYVAKCLRRGELVAARHVQENHLKQEHLFKALEWLGQIEHDWSLRTGPHGRRMETWLRPDLWEKLTATYTGLDAAESREALIRTFDLYCTVMAEAAGKLGLEYARGTEQRVRAQIVKLLG